MTLQGNRIPTANKEVDLADDNDLDIEDFDDLDEEEEERKSATKPRKAEKPTGIGASAVADKLGANAKTFRAWLRRAVENGDVTVTEHEAKQRYSWANWKDPELIAIMKAYKAANHDRGGRKAASGKGKASAKKAPAKKGATKRRKKAASKS